MKGGKNLQPKALRIELKGYRGERWKVAQRGKDKTKGRKKNNIKRENIKCAKEVMRGIRNWSSDSSGGREGGQKKFSRSIKGERGFRESEEGGVRPQKGEKKDEKETLRTLPVGKGS